MRPLRFKVSGLSLLAILLLSSVLLAGIGCRDDRRQQLQSQLNVLDGQTDRLKQAVFDRESTLEAMNQRLTSQRSQLSEYNASVEGYMLEHKMVVAALTVGVGGVSISLDDTNEYSAEAKQWGAALATVAVIYALANMDEVSEVARTLNQADAHVRSLKADIAQTASAVERQRALLQEGQERLDLLTRQAADLQQQLQAL